MQATSFWWKTHPTLSIPTYRSMICWSQSQYQYVLNTIPIPQHTHTHIHTYIQNKHTQQGRQNKDHTLRQHSQGDKAHKHKQTKPTHPAKNMLWHKENKKIIRRRGLVASRAVGLALQAGDGCIAQRFLPHNSSKNNT